MSSISICCKKTVSLIHFLQLFFPSKDFIVHPSFSVGTVLLSTACRLKKPRSVGHFSRITATTVSKPCSSGTVHAVLDCREDPAGSSSEWTPNHSALIVVCLETVVQSYSSRMSPPAESRGELGLNNSSHFPRVTPWGTLIDALVPL